MRRPNNNAFGSEDKAAANKSRVSSAVLVIGACSNLAVLAYALYVSPNHSETFTLTFSFASLIGAIVCLAALRLPLVWRWRMAIVFSIPVFAAYGTEVYLAFTISQPSSSGPSSMGEAARQRLKHAMQQGLPFDFRTAREVLHDLREQGIDAYSGFSPLEFARYDGIVNDEDDSILPLGGISSRMTILCNESGEYAIEMSDERGFINPEGLHVPGKAEIVLVGDSFAEGACVTARESVAGQLRQRGRQALSLGRGGIGPLTELALLSEYARPLSPPIVLWLYYEGNDLRNIERESTSSVLLNYLIRSFTQNLTDRQEEIDRLLKRWSLTTKENGSNNTQQREAAIVSTRFFIQTFKLTLLRSVFRDRFTPPPPLPALLHTVLVEARDRVESWGGQLYFVYLPEWRRYANGFGDDYKSRRRVMTLVDSLGIPAIDFHETLSNQKDPLAVFPLRMYGHYNAPGYEMLAEVIDKSLRESGRSKRLQSPAPPVPK